jgi:hypothetical protein
VPQVRLDPQNPTRLPQRSSPHTLISKKLQSIAVEPGCAALENSIAMRVNQGNCKN